MARSIRAAQTWSFPPIRADQAGIPELVEVRAVPVEADLGQVPAAVAVVADVERLVDVGDEVDEEEQRRLPVGLGLRAVGQDAAVVGDLVDDVVGRLRVAAVGVVGLADRDVGVVPRGAPG